MKKLSLLACIALTGLLLTAQTKKEEKQLMIRLDDLGFCHAANMGAEKILKSGFPVSVSVMAPGPWFEEAVRIIKKYPNASVGVHLTLNAEWENYKWGPVLGPSAVPTLVDSLGYFPWKVTWFYKDIMKLDELEKELTAQIEKVINAGLKVDYIDGHMGACGMTPEQIALMEKLAQKYHAGISGYFQEKGLKGVEGFYQNRKMEDFFKSIADIQNGLSLIVNHPGADTPEMQALNVQTDKAEKDAYGTVAKQRAAVAENLSSEKFKEVVAKNNIKLINYKMLIEQRGLASMKK